MVGTSLTLLCPPYEPNSSGNYQISIRARFDNFICDAVDEAIIDTDVFVENAKKFGTYCGKNPTMSIVDAALSVLGK